MEGDALVGSQQQPPQVYDSVLKELIQQHVEDIVPILLPGVSYAATLDIERIRPTLRVDRVYRIVYRGEEHILHLEFESGQDNDMASRLLTYHAILYYIRTIICPSSRWLSIRFV
jgi:hypothetical protein